MAISCFKVHHASPTAVKEPFSGTPELRIGSFIPSRAPAAFMQGMLMKHLLGGLLERANQLTQAVVPRLEGSKDKDGRVLALQCEALKERQASKLEQIGTIGEEMMKIDFRI